MNANALSKQFEYNLNKCIVLYFMYDVKTSLRARELGTECRYKSLCNCVVVCGGIEVFHDFQNLAFWKENLATHTDF